VTATRGALAALSASGAALPIAAILLVGSVPAAALDCSDEGEQTQMKRNACAADAHREAEVRLNDTWLKLRDVMRHGMGAYDPEASFPMLVETQRAWITYRDKQCATEALSYAGGSAQPQIVNNCLARITDARTRELEDMLFDY
jgi:uncharacterized protein YecT (DUF1311 family)